MKAIFVSLLMLAGAASAWAQEGKYKIEGKTTDGEAEIKGVKRPAFLVEGTTNLPDKSVLSCYVFYQTLKPGRDLAYRAVEVKDGKFAVTFGVYLEKNLAGKHVFQVLFNPYLQQSAIQENLGKDLRQYDASWEFVLGTEADLVRARRAVFERLGREIAAMKDVCEEIQVKLGEARKSYDKAAWKKLCEDWRRRAHEAEERCHNVAEFKALNVDDISEQGMDDFSLVLHRMVEAATALLENPGKAAEIETSLKGHAAGFEKFRRSIVQRLGLEKASAKELSASLAAVRGHAAAGLELYDWLRKDPKANLQVFHARAEEARKNFTKLVMAIDDIAPAKYHQGIAQLSEKGVAWLKKVDEAGDAKEDQTDNLKKALDEFVKEAAELEATFKD